MKDPANLHLKMQEMCDCYATTDPLKEMSKIIQESGDDEHAIKWFALAVLHGLNANAETIAIKQDENGQTRVTATYRESELPSPGATVGENVFKAIKEVSHIEGDRGEMIMPFGFRNNSFDLLIESKTEGNKKTVVIKFP